MDGMKLHRWNFALMVAPTTVDEFVVGFEVPVILHIIYGKLW